eukprot:TRINITY_DN17259_c0_g1_i12.p1 TRINITY_DN17259_c0_g1~~TRINITY_DN17259_c0_g1_i12.p1  ORF type:complete len:416 (+),score=152.74 TRINITY_DN17259_c0_g1_i12:696-1943(+)
MKELEKIKQDMQRLQEKSTDKDIISEEYEKLINTLHSERSISGAAIGKLKEELHELRAAIGMHERNAKCMEESKGRLEQEIEGMKKKLEEADKEVISSEYIEIIEDLNLKLEETSEKIYKQNGVIKKFKEKTEYLKKENEGLKEKIKLLEKSSTQNKSESKRPARKPSNTKVQPTKTKEVLGNIVQSCIQINIDSKPRVNKEQETSKAKKELIAKVSDLEKEKEELKSNYQAKVAELEKVKEKAKTFWETFEKYNKKKQELEKEVKKLQTEAASSSKKIEEHTNKINELTSILEQVKTENNELHSKNTILREDKQEERDALNIQLKARTEQLEKELNELRSRLKEKDKQVDDQKGDCKVLLLKFKDDYCKLFKKFNNLKKSLKTEREALRAKDKEVEFLKSKLDVTLCNMSRRRY